jgi:hypothetical protein
MKHIVNCSYCDHYYLNESALVLDEKIKLKLEGIKNDKSINLDLNISNSIIPSTDVNDSMMEEIETINNIINESEFKKTILY